MRIVVADDDAVYRRVLQSTLSDWGYEVSVCSDGAEAWDAVDRDDPPGIALLDWLMPGINGLELCRRLRESRALDSIYVILVTGKDGRQDLVKALDAGADDHLSKPFEFHELRARVRVGERLVEARRQHVQEATAHYVTRLEQAVAQVTESRRRIVSV